MSLSEAKVWIDTQHAKAPKRITVMMMPGGQVWLSSSTGATALVMQSSDEGALNRMYVDLQDYVRTVTRAEASV